MKTQHNYRLDSVTESQLTWLSTHLNTTETAVIEHAIASMYHERKATMNSKPKTLFEQAQQRVWHTPELDPHAETILDDWSEGEEHWRWVISASAAEIVDWANTIENQGDPH